MPLAKLLLISLGSLAFAQSETLTMADLKALSASGRHQEVLRSAEKVKPAERGTEWETLVASAAKGFMADLSKPGDARWAFEVGKNLKEKNPHLKSDKDFMYSVGKAGSMGMGSKAVATPFFEAALSENDERCKESVVKEAVTDAFVRSGFSEEKKSASKIAFGFCSKEIDESWAKAMTESEVGLKTACADLVKTGKLKGVRLSKCQKFAKG